MNDALRTGLHSVCERFDRNGPGSLSVEDLALLKSVPNPFTPREEALVDGLIQVLKATFGQRDRRIDALAERIAAMESAGPSELKGQLEFAKAQAETRLNNLEINVKELQASGLRYRGTYEQGGSYREGDFITHQGSTWCCRRPTTSAPGVDHDSWTLAVKKGRDGRDTR